MTLNIYQPYLNNNQLDKVSKNCIPYRIVTVDNESREYELFNEIAVTEFQKYNDPGHYFGIISLKFNIKSPIEIKEYFQYAKVAQRQSYDAFVINPMLANEALFINGWEQAIITGHTGIDIIYDHICKKLPSARQIRNRSIFALNNYFVGNQKFWSEYFSFVRSIIQDLEAESKSNSSFEEILRGSANYSRNKALTMRPFILERLATEFYYYAIYRGLKINFFKPHNEHYNNKFGKFYGPAIAKLSNMKFEGSTTENSKILLEWDFTRKEIAKIHGNTLFQLDDPDEIIFQGEKKED